MQMVELVAGMGVFIYPHMIDTVKRATTYARMAKELASCFYSGEQILQIGSLTKVETQMVDAWISKFNLYTKTSKVLIKKE